MRNMIPFWKVIPGGNPTLLLLSQDVPPEKHAVTANALMSATSVYAEQAGFVDFEQQSITMMGGEFCVNAVRAFAVLLAEKSILPSTGRDYCSGIIKCSGMEQPVEVQVQKLPNGIFFSRACLRFADLPAFRSLRDGSMLTRIPGITHIIEAGSIPQNAESFCAEQRRQNGLVGEEAVGHLWLSPCRAAQDGRYECSLFPIIWVRETSTLCQETACGSGSLAAALYLRKMHGCNMFRIMQPSGYALDVSFEQDAGSFKAWIGGPAWTATQGVAALPKDASAPF